MKKLVGQPVRELSLGERMRMELIAALLHRPDLLLLDEPTIGLDVVSQRKVQDFLKFYQAEQKLTVLLTSHYMKDVQALCRRAIIINEGEIKHDGPLAQIVDKFSTYKVIELLFSGETRPSGLERVWRSVRRQFSEGENQGPAQPGAGDPVRPVVALCTGGRGRPRPSAGGGDRRDVYEQQEREVAPEEAAVQ